MTDDHEINERIRELRDHLGLGRAAFEKETGIDRRTIEAIEQKRQKVYAWHIKSIEERWPEYGLWLAFGKTAPEAGFISPELEKLRTGTHGAGKAG